MTSHYSGSWGSDGAYSLTNNLEDANTVLDFILQDETYGFDKRQIYAVGHSMGGFVCGQLSARRAEIRRAALLMPCDIGRLPQIVQEDPAAGRAIQEVLDVMIKLASENITMVVVTHEMGFARKVADRVVFMADGQIIEEGTPEHFFENPQNPRVKQFLGKILKH